ncbi:MAG: hypothetical protein J5545_07310 [Bacteroidaceae bacterium]|nr:hypothetical protein [Bacteroidaceae bacterium]
MNGKFTKVPVRGMTAEEVLSLWQAGKLYREVEAEAVSEEALLARCRQEALAYVAAIDEFATAAWRPYINKVWEALTSSNVIQEKMMIKKGVRTGQLNRYFITAIVVMLHEKDVYKLSVPALRLHCVLEQVEKKNNYYVAYSKYTPEKAQRKVICQVLMSFSEEIKNQSIFT